MGMFSRDKDNRVMDIIDSAFGQGRQRKPRKKRGDSGERKATLETVQVPDHGKIQVYAIETPEGRYLNVGSGSSPRYLPEEEAIEELRRQMK